MSEVIQHVANVARRIFYKARHERVEITEVAAYHDALRRLGSGHFSAVYECEGLALKFSSRSRCVWGGHWENGMLNAAGKPALDGWQLFARHCLHNPAENLPRILHFEQLQYGTAFGIMPIYKPLGSSASEVIIHDWKDQLRGLSSVEPWLQPIRQMVETLELRVDIHSDNVMRDPVSGLTILTDPFSTAGTYL